MFGSSDGFKSQMHKQLNQTVKGTNGEFILLQIIVRIIIQTRGVLSHMYDNARE